MKQNHNINSIPQCWLCKDKRYIYMEHGEIGDELPTIGIEYADILEKLEIPFQQISDTRLEFWSPELYEEVELDLPTYIIFEDNLRRVKNHTGYVITEATQDEAFRLLQEVVMPAIDKFEREQKEEEERRKREQERLEEEQEKELLTLELVDILNRRPAVGLGRYSVLISLYKECDLKYGGFNLKIIPVFTLCSLIKQCDFNDYIVNFCGEDPRPETDMMFRKLSDYNIVVNMNELPSDGILELPVPEGTEGIFIGRGGWQIKEWCKKLGLRRINVVPMK